MKHTKVWIVLAGVLLAAGCSPRVAVNIAPLAATAHVQVSSTQVRPGHALRILVQSAAGARIQLAGFDQCIDAATNSASAGLYEALLAVPLETSPGFVHVTVTASAPGRLKTTVPQKIEILPREPFKTSWLQIKDFKLERYEEESKLFAETRRNSPGFQGPPIRSFQWPVRGRITETFGSKRIYNEGLSPWYHSGLDIAAPGGTTIAAPADGVVILAGMFKAHGGTVLVDHGYGVVTAYLHQRAILVKPGDVLRRGDPIGEVGSTGGSTGNHLHFQVNIHGTQTSPWDFLEEP